MRVAGQSALLIGALALVGCDRFSGVEEQKMLDAEAIGYACRVSLKTPEDCMKENEAQSPTSVLGGWKSADKDIKEKKLDPTMGKRAGSDLTAHSGTAATDAEGKTATDNAEKNGDAKSETDKKKTNR